MSRWIGKVAVVTGASSGIGASIVNHLVDNGLIIVVGLARRSDKIQVRAKELVGREGKLFGIRTDMTKEKEILEAFNWIKNNLGQVHILINNAGVLKKTYLFVRKAVNVMMKNNVKGHIVHINSITGHKISPFPIFNIYGASKYGVTSLAGTLREELNEIGANIKVTSLSPGLVGTEMTTLNTEYSRERQALMNSMPVLNPADIAEAVCYILSTPVNVQIQEMIITPMGEKL